MTGLTLATIAWGALAFGAVYPWAYWPLFGGAATAGALGWIRGRTNWARSPHRPLVVTMMVLACCVGLQVTPFPRNAIEALSPSTTAILRQHDLAFAAGLTRHHTLSIDPAATSLALAAFTVFALFVVGVARGLSPPSAIAVADGIAALGFVVALIAIVQRASDTDRIYGFWQPQDQPFQIFGPFVNRNHFAGWMIMALSVALGALAARLTNAMRGVRSDWRSRVLWLSTADANRLVLHAFFAAVMALALVLTRSRSGILCFGATLALAGWFVIREQRQRPAHRLVAAAYLVFLALVTLGWAGIDPTVRRFANEPGLSGRADAWRAAIEMAGDFPAVGTGLNTYGTAILFYGPSLKVHWGAAHNDYLQLASEGGLLVGVPIVVAVVMLAREMRRRLRSPAQNPALRWIRIGAVMGLVAAALQAFVDFSLQLPGVAALFSVLCAVAIHGAPKRARQSPMLAGPHPRSPTPSRRSARRNFHMRPFGSRRCFARGAPPPLANAFAPQRSA